MPMARNSYFLQTVVKPQTSVRSSVVLICLMDAMKMQLRLPVRAGKP